MQRTEYCFWTSKSLMYFTISASGKVLEKEYRNPIDTLEMHSVIIEIGHWNNLDLVYTQPRLDKNLETHLEHASS